MVQRRHVFREEEVRSVEEAEMVSLRKELGRRLNVENTNLRRCVDAARSQNAADCRRFDTIYSKIQIKLRKKTDIELCS